MPQDTDERLAELKRKLKVRENMPGFEENVRELQEEIARLERDK